MSLFDPIKDILREGGTIIGAGAGFALGGPTGAAIGAGIGSSVSGSIAASDARKIDQRTINEIRALIEQGRTEELAALQAGDAEAAAAIRSAVAQQLAVYDEIIDERFPERVAALRQIFAPFIDVGVGALGQQAAMLGIPGPDGEVNEFDPDIITTRPSFKFVEEQGNRAVDRTAAARSGVLGGRAVKESQRFAAGLASQEFNNEFNRLGSLSTLGANASANLASQVNAAYSDLFNVMMGKAGVFGAQGEAMANLALSTAQAEIGISQNRSDSLIALSGADAASRKNELSANQANQNNLVNNLITGVALTSRGPSTTSGGGGSVPTRRIPNASNNFLPRSDRSGGFLRAL